MDAERFGDSSESHFFNNSLRHIALEKIAPPGLRELARSGTKMIEVKDEGGNMEAFSQLIGDGMYPIIVLNHQSLADIGVAVQLIDRINERCDLPIIFNMPVAMSINEHQGGFVKVFYDSVKPWVKDHRIEIFEVARKKDRTKYKISPTHETNRALGDTVFTENRGLIVFVEGVQDGGRTDENTGMINGMVKIENNQVPNQLKNSVGVIGRGVALLPVGIEGTFRIFNPNNGRLPREAWECLLYQRIPGVNPKLATATVGELFTSDEIVEEGISIDDFSGVNTCVGKKIASLLSSSAQGFYGE